jgi:CheY-like chemotaxis protein
MTNNIYYIILLIVILLLFIILIFNINKTNNYAKTNLELHLAVKEAEKKLKVDKDLYYRFLRDIRTQMNNVVGFASLGLDETKNKVIYDYFKEIIDANNENKGLIECYNNILVNHGKGDELELEYVSLENLIANVKKENVNDLKTKNQILNIEYSFVENLYLIIDRKKLKLILNNLVKVAIKYGDKESTINLAFSEKIGSDKNSYKIELETIGQKVDSNELMYVNKSSSYINHTDNVKGNLSFNLLVIHYLVESLGGTYHGVNTEHGNMFNIKIPFKKITQQQFKNSIYFQDKINQKSKSLVGKRVLVVEDNDINAKIEINLLKKFGMEVERVENGKKALLSFHGHEVGYYDVILMDIRMPEMNGLRATNAIRKISREDSMDIPIIGLTACVIGNSEKECLEYGMNEYLSKPIDVNKLRVTLEKYIK